MSPRIRTAQSGCRPASVTLRGRPRPKPGANRLDMRAEERMLKMISPVPNGYSERQVGGHGRITATDLICLIRRCNRRCAHETLGTLASRTVGCWCLRSEAGLAKWVGEFRWPVGDRRRSAREATLRTG